MLIIVGWWVMSCEYLWVNTCTHIAPGQIIFYDYVIQYYHVMRKNVQNTYFHTSGLILVPNSYVKNV